MCGSAVGRTHLELAGPHATLSLPCRLLGRHVVIGVPPAVRGSVPRTASEGQGVRSSMPPAAHRLPRCQVAARCRAPALHPAWSRLRQPIGPQASLRSTPQAATTSCHHAAGRRKLACRQLPALAPPSSRSGRGWCHRAAADSRPPPSGQTGRCPSADGGAFVVEVVAISKGGQWPAREGHDRRRAGWWQAGHTGRQAGRANQAGQAGATHLLAPHFRAADLGDERVPGHLACRQWPVPGKHACSVHAHAGGRRAVGTVAGAQQQRPHAASSCRLGCSGMPGWRAGPGWRPPPQ